MGARFGSITRQRGLIIVAMRVAIDGDALSILTPGLERLAAVNANDLSVFPGGIVLYRNPQPHFQPTHFVTMTLLDLRLRDDAGIYPPMPYDRVRAEEIFPGATRAQIPQRAAANPRRVPWQ